MKKHLLKLLICSAVIVLISTAFVCCKSSDNPPSNENKPKITATVENALMITGESFYLDYTISDEKNSEKTEYVVEYSVEGDSVKVDENGVVTAEKAGDSTVKIKIKDTEQTAECKIIVGNIIVDAKATPEVSAKTDNSKKFAVRADYTVTKKGYGGIKGETLFDNLSEGVEKAKENDYILVQSGNYNESVTIAKSVTVRGVDKPVFKGITISSNTSVTLENLCLADSTYPGGTGARVYVQDGASLVMSDCVLTTNSTEELTGGYGVFAKKQAKKVELKNNTLSNFRYGIYICPTDGEVKITNNKLSNMNVGIGLDIRQENSSENYPTKGEIKTNEYNEIEAKTSFLHHGDNYSGEFDFEDNELENASKDEGQTGGSGLTE